MADFCSFADTITTGGTIHQNGFRRDDLPRLNFVCAGLLFDCDVFAAAPGRVIGLAADLLIGADADVIFLLFRQLGDGFAGGLTGLYGDRFRTFEFAGSRILNLIASHFVV